MKQIFLCLPLLLACTPSASPVPPLVTPEASGCGYQQLLGQKISATILPRDLMHRVIGPGQVITLDHNPDRVNFETDNAGVIKRVWCG